MLTQTLDQQYLAHTYNRFPLEIVGGKGSLLRGADGREYIDLGSGIGVNIFGMDDDEWRDAVTAQLGRFQHVSNLYYSEPAAKLAQMLCERTGLKRVFFSNSGAESNECAIKAARKWAAEHKGSEYCSIITLRGSFHGRTLGTLAATGQDVFHRDYQPLPGGFLYAQPGECEALERLVAEHPCAAILFEAVQGEGGVRPIGQEFASCLQEVCRKHDLLLMADEVQLGNGRSGSLYGYMNYGLQPDVVSTAKGIGGGLPLGVTMFGERVADVFHPGDHGTTFGGNHLACAAAIAVADVMAADRLVDHARELGDYLIGELKKLPRVKEVRGRGLMIGVELFEDAAPLRRKLLFDEKIFVGSSGDKNTFRLLPALNIGREHADRLLEALRKLLTTSC